MSTRLFDKGRQGFANKLIDWTNDTIKGMLTNLTTVDTFIKAITAATNPGTPVQLTITGHGFSVGDTIVTFNVGGNTAANGTFKIKGVVDANNVTIQTTTPEALDVTGNGAYTSGGIAINLTAPTFRADVDAGSVSISPAFASKTNSNGILGAADPTFSAVTNGTTSHAMVVYQDTGATATDRLVSFHDGKHQVIVAGAAASSATTIIVEPLEAAIPNGTVLNFSNGINATLTAQPAQFARSLTVSALSSGIAVGHTADAPSTASPNFPISGNGGNITINIDTATNKLLKL